MAAAAAVLGAFAVAGCSYPLDAIYEKTETDMQPTGSTAASGRSDQMADAAPSEADLAYARAVAADAVAHGAKDSSIPWQNPQTGAGGNITPLAASYGDGALVCRDFLASYVHGQSQAWLQGAACRMQHGKWEVKSLKPLKQG